MSRFRRFHLAYADPHSTYRPTQPLPETAPIPPRCVSRYLALASTRNAAHTRREHLVLRWHAVAEDQVFIAIDKTKCTKESECKTEAAEGFSRLVLNYYYYKPSLIAKVL